jgi:hypothetical protein
MCYLWRMVLAELLLGHLIVICGLSSANVSYLTVTRKGSSQLNTLTSRIWLPGYRECDRRFAKRYSLYYLVVSRAILISVNERDVFQP